MTYASSPLILNFQQTADHRATQPGRPEYTTPPAIHASGLFSSEL